MDVAYLMIGIVRTEKGKTMFKVIDKYTDEVFIVYSVNNRSFLIYHPKHEYWGWELMDGFKPYGERKDNDTK
jgi:hypothetical protein